MLRYTVFLLLTLLVISCSSAQLSPLSFFKQGNEAVERQDYKQAIDSYKTAISLDGTQAVFFYNLGSVYYKIQLDQAALDNFNQALRLDSKFAEAWYNKALTLHRMHHIDDSLYAYDQYKKLASSQYAPKTYQKQQEQIKKQIEDSAHKHNQQTINQKSKKFAPIPKFTKKRS